MKVRSLALSIGCALAASTMAPAHAACTAGQFDSSFGPAASAGYVQVSPWVPLSLSTGFESLVFGGDNNVYVTGAFAVDSVSTYPYAGVMRTARGGAIDRSYGGMGVVIAGGQAAPAISSGPNADIAVDANGNLVAAVITGTGMSISRFLPDGTRDTSFGSGGVTTVALSNPWYLLGIQVAADGSVFVGTSATNPASPSNLYQPVVVKVKSNGTPDATFGSGGIAFVYPTGLASNSNARMADIALLPSGDIIGVGRIVDPAVGTWFQAFATKIHGSDGTLDATFGTAGFTIINSGPANNFLLRKVLIQPDGRVVGSGSTTAFGGSASFSTVARFNGDGSLDATFGTAGVSRFLPAFDSFVVHSTLQDNGKIVVAIQGFADAGDTIDAAAVARLTTTGALDTNFNGTGSMSIPAAGPTAGNIVRPINVKVNNHRIFTSTQVYTPDLARYAVFLTAVDAGNGAHCY